MIAIYLAAIEFPYPWTKNRREKNWRCSCPQHARGRAARLCIRSNFRRRRGGAGFWTTPLLSLMSNSTRNGIEPNFLALTIEPRIRLKLGMRLNFITGYPRFAVRLLNAIFTFILSQQPALVWLLRKSCSIFKEPLHNSLKVMAVKA